MPEKDKQDKLPQKPPIIGSDDIEADVDLGDSIAQEFGKYSARKAKLAAPQVKEEPLSTDHESDQTRTDINIGSSE
jgi:hypothetical protein